MSPTPEKSGIYQQNGEFSEHLAIQGCRPLQKILKFYKQNGAFWEHLANLRMFPTPENFVILHVKWYILRAFERWRFSIGQLFLPATHEADWLCEWREREIYQNV